LLAAGALLLTATTGCAPEHPYSYYDPPQTSPFYNNAPPIENDGSVEGQHPVVPDPLPQAEAAPSAPAADGSTLVPSEAAMKVANDNIQNLTNDQKWNLVTQSLEAYAELAHKRHEDRRWAYAGALAAWMRAPAAGTFPCFPGAIAAYRDIAQNLDSLAGKMRIFNFTEAEAAGIIATTYYTAFVVGNMAKLCTEQVGHHAAPHRRKHHKTAPKQQALPPGTYEL